MMPSEQELQPQIINIEQNCEIHSEPFRAVILNSQNVEEALQCFTCIQNNTFDTNIMIGFEQYQEQLIQQRQNELRILWRQIQKYLEYCISLKTAISEFQISTNNQIVYFISHIEDWENQIKSIPQKYLTIDFQKQYQNQQSIESEALVDIKILQQNALRKMSIQVQQILEQQGLRRCFDILNDVAREVQGQSIIKRNLSLIPSINLDKPIKISQPEMAYAIKINSNQLIASCGKEIKLYTLNQGSLQFQQQLGGHQGTIQCLVENRTHNWMASGALDGEIKVWRLQSNGSWNGITSIRRHNSVKGLLLNKSETEFISYGDSNIIVWQINYASNSIRLRYSLENQTAGNILCVSQNQSETVMVASRDNKTIDLWKNDDDNWKYINSIKTQNMVLRVCFIAEKLVLFQDREIGVMSCYRLFGDNLQRINQLRLNNENDDEMLFPAIFNGEKRIIIQKHNKFVYVIKWKLDGKFIVIQEIDCGCSSIYGSLSDDAQLLAIWSSETKMHNIYKIEYHMINQINI